MRQLYVILMIGVLLVCGCRLDGRGDCAGKAVNDEELCFKCHTEGRFEVKQYDYEEALFASRPRGLELHKSTKCSRGDCVDEYNARYKIEDIDSDDIREVHRYLLLHPEISNHITFEFHSPGGAIQEMVRIVWIFNEMRKDGYQITGLVNGAAHSAGFYLFQQCDYRIISEAGELMWHKPTYEPPGMMVPSYISDEDQIYLNTLLRRANKIIAERTGGKLTREYLDAQVESGDWYITSTEALELGLADEVY